MTRTDLDSGKLKDAHHKLGLTIQTLATEAAELDVQIERLHRQKAAKEEIKKESEFEREIAERALVIVKNIPDKVLQIRQRMFLLSGEVMRKDRKVSTIEKRQRELDRLKEEIKSICNHPLVVEYPGGRDSDENTRWPGSRTCALCCFMEEGTFAYPVGFDLETDWGVLVECRERILCWGNNHRELKEILRKKNYWSISAENIIGFFLDDRMLTVQEGKPLKHFNLADFLNKCKS